MSTESIIGLVASIFGIIGGVIAFIKWVYPKIVEKYIKFPYAKTFYHLTQSGMLDEDRRKILRKLNDSPFFKDCINEDYIKKFTLGKRGREAVLFDICDSNNIELTDDICVACLNAHMPSLVTKYEEKRKKQQEIPAQDSFEPNNTNELTSNNKTKEQPTQVSGRQTVYMSELLKERYPDTFDRLIKILEKHHIKYAFLKGTKDIWCRDYMPVQTKSGKLIQFKYDPSYLKGNEEWEKSRSDVREVCKANGIEPQFSDINLDGGNVLIYDDRAIISDRIFSENPGEDRDELKKKLTELLECKDIIIIPAYAKSYDMTGHADGMVRFVNRNTILGNRRDEESDTWKKNMQRAIDKYDLTYIEVPLITNIIDKEHPDSAIGVYVNYLEVGNLIVMPIFGRDEDDQAKEVIQKAFPDRVIETIDYNDVALEGGLLNCTTWVVKY